MGVLYQVLLWYRFALPRHPLCKVRACAAAPGRDVRSALAHGTGCGDGVEGLFAWSCLPHAARQPAPAPSRLPARSGVAARRRSRARQRLRGESSRWEEEERERRSGVGAGSEERGRSATKGQGKRCMRACLQKYRINTYLYSYLFLCRGSWESRVSRSLRSAALPLTSQALALRPSAYASPARATALAPIRHTVPPAAAAVPSPQPLVVFTTPQPHEWLEGKVISGALESSL